MSERVYKDHFTMDGRLKAVPSVTPTKVKAIKSLVEKALNGDHIATGYLKETLSTSDAIFSYAYLTQINILPEFDRAPRTWTQIAGQRTVPDFRKPVLYSIATNWAGPGVLSANGGAPVIPEGEPYPYAYISGEEAATAGIAKRGFKTDLTWETAINDLVGYLAALPGEMLRVFLDTEEEAVYSALIGGVTSTQGLAGGTTPSGATVPVNAPVGRDALIRAIFELSQRKVNGRYIQNTGGYNLLVPIGQKIFVDYILTQAFSTVQSGSGNGQLVFNIQGYDPLSGITVIETPYVTGTQWYLLPKPGTTSGRPFLEILKLAGHENPEIRVENFTGTYLGGGTVPPFEGSFANDTITFRGRLPVGGVVWTPSLGLFSNGSGA